MEVIARDGEGDIKDLKAGVVDTRWGRQYDEVRLLLTEVWLMIRVTFIKDFSQQYITSSFQFQKTSLSFRSFHWPSIGYNKVASIIKPYKRTLIPKCHCKPIAIP